MSLLRTPSTSTISKICDRLALSHFNMKTNLAENLAEREVYRMGINTEVRLAFLDYKPQVDSTTAGQTLLLLEKLIDLIEYESQIIYEV